MANPDLTPFKALSFDCYGTLIDWESGLLTDFTPLLAQLPPSHPWATSPALALERFNAISEHLEETNPTQLYPATLSASLVQLASELSLAPTPSLSAAVTKIATGPGRWPAFPDTISGLLRLRKHFKLIILSNVNNANITSCIGTSLAPAQFDAVYTAEAIGAYKPSHANFRYLFSHARADLDVDFDRGELLHVARSLTADHVPAKELGFRSVWISRGGDQEGNYGTGGDLGKLTDEGKLGFEWKFDTIGEFADEVDRQFAAKEKGE
ncbi:Haloacid dehalogenase-like hydrolase-domain-containing protein [Lasiosphaeria hispida]|uniref:Haloacid dehalogenase-like hydrolase-domain-containing protein n=1 Tax=Lasiosphaeria hispida TaxID=260671 RepID=A0AAJ0M8M6_9PEZI|nr:Haloacid dehalogenase-like hydrolase-domain-containing protein [Lasiosphaeria hispida]